MIHGWDNYLSENIFLGINPLHTVSVSTHNKFSVMEIRKNSTYNKVRLRPERSCFNTVFHNEVEKKQCNMLFCDFKCFLIDVTHAALLLLLYQDYQTYEHILQMASWEKYWSSLTLASARTARIENPVCLDPVILFCGRKYGNDLMFFISLRVIIKPPFLVKADLIDVHLQSS